MKLKLTTLYRLARLEEILAEMAAVASGAAMPQGVAKFKPVLTMPLSAYLELLRREGKGHTRMLTRAQLNSRSVLLMLWPVLLMLSPVLFLSWPV
jgi:hypothetical protein